MYTPSFFRKNYPEWKRKKDWLPTRCFYRPLSFIMSSMFANIGWTANTVSYFSAFVGIAACALFVIGKPFAGALLINAWLVLDCADGNIARSIRRERYGDFADSMSSYICVGFLFASIGICVYQIGGFFIEPGNPWIILIGAYASSSDSLMRLIYQKFLTSSYEQGLQVEHVQDPASTHGINQLRLKIDGYFSLGGVLPIALILASVGGFLDAVIFFWFVYYSLTLSASVAYLIIKTFKANNLA